MQRNTRKPEILIKTDGTKPEIIIDGVKLEGVTGFRFVQNHENYGLPRLQIDLKATNVTLDAQVLPTLPQPFARFYIPISKLADSEDIPRDVVMKLCKECGIDMML